MERDMKRRMVFDVESVGLHGDGWAVGYVLLVGDQVVDKVWAWCNPDNAAGTSEGREWVKKNCRWARDGLDPAVASELGLTAGRRFLWPSEVRQWFWETWLNQASQGAELWCDVPWPVEARFLAVCVEDKRSDQVSCRELGKTPREFEGPFPLFDVRSYVESIMGPSPSGGASPLAPLEVECAMVHHPLADAMLSAKRLLGAEAFLKKVLPK
jgi:hypothetical protein